MRELSAKLTEGEIFERQSHFSPSVKTFGFATSLIRGRLWHDIRNKHIGTCFTSTRRSRGLQLLVNIRDIWGNLCGFS